MCLINMIPSERMSTGIVALIDDKPDDLEVMEGVIREIDPELSCISFVYADEAVRVMEAELKRLPDYIFIDANMRRKPGVECLTELRGNSAFDNSQIIMFSVVMPAAVVDSFKAMGATHAFQKPLVRYQYKEIFHQILKT